MKPQPKSQQPIARSAIRIDFQQLPEHGTYVSLSATRWPSNPADAGALVTRLLEDHFRKTSPLIGIYITVAPARPPEKVAT